MPTIATAAVVKSGMSTKLRTVSTMAMPVPMPNSAVPIGRPMASTDPNAMSRMIMAAAMPMASLAPFIPGLANMPPPNSMVRPGTSIFSARALISLPWSVNASPERSAKLTSA